MGRECLGPEVCVPCGAGGEAVLEVEVVWDEVFIASSCFFSGFAAGAEEDDDDEEEASGEDDAESAGTSRLLMSSPSSASRAMVFPTWMLDSFSSSCRSGRADWDGRVRRRRKL